MSFDRSITKSWAAANLRSSCVALVSSMLSFHTYFDTVQPYLPQSGFSSWRPAQLKPEPYTPGSRVQLASSEAPSEAATYVREQNLHFAFGDFDDHLEDVTIGEKSSPRGVSVCLIEDALSRRLAEESLVSAMSVSCICILNICLPRKGSNIASWP